MYNASSNLDMMEGKGADYMAIQDYLADRELRMVKERAFKAVKLFISAEIQEVRASYFPHKSNISVIDLGMFRRGTILRVEYNGAVENKYAWFLVEKMDQGKVLVYQVKDGQSNGPVGSEFRSPEFELLALDVKVREFPTQDSLKVLLAETSGDIDTARVDVMLGGLKAWHEM